MIHGLSAIYPSFFTGVRWKIYQFGSLRRPVPKRLKVTVSRRCCFGEQAEVGDGTPEVRTLEVSDFFVMQHTLISPIDQTRDQIVEVLAEGNAVERLYITHHTSWELRPACDKCRTNPGQYLSPNKNQLIRI